MLYIKIQALFQHTDITLFQLFFFTSSSLPPFTFPEGLRFSFVADVGFCNSCQKNYIDIITVVFVKNQNVSNQKYESLSVLKFVMLCLAIV